MVVMEYLIVLNPVNDYGKSLYSISQYLLGSVLYQDGWIIFFKCEAFICTGNYFEIHNHENLIYRSSKVNVMQR